VAAQRPRAAAGDALVSGNSRHVFFALAAIGALMGSIDITIMAVAVPQIATYFDAPLTWVGWTITVYQLVLIVMLPLAGKLSDSLGRKQVFLFCLGMFTLGSLLCALAPSIWFLVAARAVQAIGGGGLMPSAIGVISDAYRENRAQARGMLSSVLPIGGVIGPSLGGFIVEHWSWREMFIINVPVGAAVCVGVWLLLKGDTTRKRSHIDVPGLALYAVAIVLLLTAMGAVGDDPAMVRNPLVWAAVVGSVVLFVAFFRYIKRAANPVMDYDLVATRPYLWANLYSMVYGAVVFGLTSFVPTYAVYHYGMSALESGTVMTPRALIMIVISTAASLWVIRLGYRLPMVIGMLVVTVSLFFLGQGWREVEIGPITLSGFWLLAIFAAGTGLGAGICNPASANAALDLAPERVAAMGALRSMFRYTGGILSVGVIVMVVSLYPDPGDGLTVCFLGLSGLVFLSAFISLLIPDTARERWKRQRLREARAMSAASQAERIGE
jgi:EmrB/QacA subfamily drug resistance transporter